MVRIGNVWDSTTDVLVGRAGLLLPIAALAFFLPSAVQGAMGAYAGTSVGVAALGSLIGLAVLAAALWGQLAIVAVASDPGTTGGDAAATANRRLPAMLLVTLILIAATIAAVLPILAVLTAGGFDWAAFSARAGSSAAPAVPAGAALFCFLYGLLLSIIGLWVGARLFVLAPVVLNQRRGVGAIARSFRLTRGLALKLVGVAILFVIVLLVAALAAQSVLFVTVRLLLGPAHLPTATFLGDLAAGAVSAAFSTIAAVFAARLYAAIMAGDAGASVSLVK